MAVAIDRHVEETGPVDPDRFAREISSGFRPIVMRGQAANWPAVAAARESDEKLVGYMRRFDAGKPTEVLVGPPEINGRFFYDDGMTHCNFQKRLGTIGGLLAKLLELRASPAPNALYAGAAATGDLLPGWTDENPLGLPLPGAAPRIWIGNASRVSTHFDEASNVAVVVAGKRRFTLFPPEQLRNLYVGPFHFTIAGPPVSMVDVEDPDLDRYPRFSEALDHALVADLEPGDALFIPPIWWHNVRASGPFNVMVNYWWEEPNSVSGIGALIHAVLGLRDLPKDYRQAWKHWFDHYVFDDDAPHAADHLPDHVRGALAPPSAARNAAVKRQLASDLGGSD